jgi:hypothetical protein
VEKVSERCYERIWLQHIVNVSPAGGNGVRLFVSRITSESTDTQCNEHVYYSRNNKH